MRATVAFGRLPERSEPRVVDVVITDVGNMEVSSLPELSSCGILLAVVPTSTASVPEEVIGPPVSPVPAVTLVTVPPLPTALAQAPELY